MLLLAVVAGAPRQAQGSDQVLGKPGRQGVPQRRAAADTQVLGQEVRDRGLGLGLGAQVPVAVARHDAFIKQVEVAAQLHRHPHGRVVADQAGYRRCQATHREHPQPRGDPERGGYCALRGRRSQRIIHLHHL